MTIDGEPIRKFAGSTGLDRANSPLQPPPPHREGRNDGPFRPVSTHPRTEMHPTARLAPQDSESARPVMAEPVRYAARVLCAEGLAVKARGLVDVEFIGDGTGSLSWNSARIECRTALLNFSGEAAVRERSGMFEVRLETPGMRLTLLSLLRSKLTEPPHSMIGTMDLHAPGGDGFACGRYVIACTLPGNGIPVP